jgi:hypothetical protein
MTYICTKHDGLIVAGLAAQDGTFDVLLLGEVGQSKE